ncbi:Homeodomain-like protein, partial [Ascodesmis nigricans]
MAPTRRTNLSEFEKGQIIALHRRGDSNRKIAEALGRSEASVRKFVSRYNQTGDIKPPSKAGRPQKLDERTKRLLVRKAKMNRRQQFRELRNEVCPEVSVRTVKRALREA